MADAFLYSDTVGESLATAFVAQYEAGVVVYANAGHPPALIVGHHGDTALDPTGPLLGVTPTPGFEQAEVLLELDHRLVAYTDGLVEAYGPAAILDAADVAEMIRNMGIDSLHASVRSARHEPVRDDIALLELWRLPSTRTSPANMVRAADEDTPRAEQ